MTVPRVTIIEPSEYDEAIFAALDEIKAKKPVVDVIFRGQRVAAIKTSSGPLWASVFYVIGGRDTVHPAILGLVERFRGKRSTWAYTIEENNLVRVATPCVHLLEHPDFPPDARLIVGLPTIGNGYTTHRAAMEAYGLAKANQRRRRLMVSR